MLKLFGTEQVFQFKGAYEHQIKLTLFPHRPLPAQHVVVLPFYQDQLVLTQHKERGIEWPGGKVEKAELPLSAAIRELYEETGGQAQAMWFIGQYEVTPAGVSQSMKLNQSENRAQEKEFLAQGPQLPFVKNIYVAMVQNMEKHHSGSDTLGYTLVPIDIIPTEGAGFSPLILDPVFDIVRREVVLNQLRHS